MTRRVLTVAVVLAVAATLVLGAAYVFQRSLIYYPMGAPDSPAAAALPGGMDVTLRTADGLTLAAWFFPARGASEHDPDDPAVLVAPGNGGDRSLRVPLAEELTERGMSVLLLDYRGYGGNEGSPSESGLARDAVAAREFLLDEAGVRPDRLIYFGESLGGGVVAGLARAHPPAAMLLRSPFTELADTAAHHYPFLPARALLRDRYPVAGIVRALNGVPVRVVYGTEDAIVPGEQSRAVARAAGTEPVAVPGADHNDPALLAGPEVISTTAGLARTVSE